MLNCSASLAMSTSVLKALPGKLDIKRHSPSILYMTQLYFALMLPLNVSIGVFSPETSSHMFAVYFTIDMSHDVISNNVAF